MDELKRAVLDPPGTITITLVFRSDQRLYAVVVVVVVVELFVYGIEETRQHARHGVELVMPESARMRVCFA